MADVALQIDNLHGFYGDSHILHGLSLAVTEGEAVAIIGRNGVGKTTTMRAIMGLLERRTGSIKVKGKETISSPPEAIARLGVGFVPEERGIYASLDVAENLLLPPKLSDSGASLDEIYRLFPNLFERRRSQGTRLSGGEQQMLAIARVLRTGANIFLLDEPTEGLAPVIVDQICDVIDGMKRRGHTIILVEQNFHVASQLADRHCIMEHGRIVDVIDRSELTAKLDRIRSLLGI